MLTFILAFFAIVFCVVLIGKTLPMPGQTQSRPPQNTNRKTKNKLAKVSDIKPNQPGLKMHINYYAGRTRHWETGPIDWETTVYGLGKSGGEYFVLGLSHELGFIRHYKLGSTHYCVDAKTGEQISDIKGQILKFNPTLFNMDDYFNQLDENRGKDPDQDRLWLNVD